jgi:putative phosphoesterase
MATKPTRLGLISDTHGLLREEALRALQGSELILHAGDVGKREILEKLKAIAPVIAVRGNVDVDDWCKELPNTTTVEAGDISIYMLHNLWELDLKPEAAGISLVISGHTHKPVRSERKGVVYINPGSAGPRRFDLPITLGRLDLSGGAWNYELIDLEGQPLPGSSKKEI